MSDRIRGRDIVIGFAVTSAILVFGLAMWLTPATEKPEPKPDTEEATPEE